MNVKSRIVTLDEHDTMGLRAILNYGHTVGHALESATTYGRYFHGEAVSIGMMVAVHISHRLGLVDENVIKRQKSLLERFNLPVTFSDVDVGQIMGALDRDKKVKQGAIVWILLEGIGRAVLRSDVPIDLVDEILTELNVSKQT